MPGTFAFHSKEESGGMEYVLLQRTREEREKGRSFLSTTLRLVIATPPSRYRRQTPRLRNDTRLPPDRHRHLPVNSSSPSISSTASSLSPSTASPPSCRRPPSMCFRACIAR